MHAPRAHPNCDFSLSYITIWSCIVMSTKQKSRQVSTQKRCIASKSQKFGTVWLHSVPPITLKLSLAAVPSRMPRHTFPFFWHKHVRRQFSHHFVLKINVVQLLVSQLSVKSLQWQWGSFQEGSPWRHSWHWQSSETVTWIPSWHQTQIWMLSGLSSTEADWDLTPV